MLLPHHHDDVQHSLPPNRSQRRKEIDCKLNIHCKSSQSRGEMIRLHEERVRTPQDEELQPHFLCGQKSILIFWIVSIICDFCGKWSFKWFGSVSLCRKRGEDTVTQPTTGYGERKRDKRGCNPGKQRASKRANGGAWEEKRQRLGVEFLYWLLQRPRNLLIKLQSQFNLVERIPFHGQDVYSFQFDIITLKKWYRGIFHSISSFPELPFREIKRKATD